MFNNIGKALNSIFWGGSNPPAVNEFPSLVFTLPKKKPEVLMSRWVPLSQLKELEVYELYSISNYSSEVLLEYEGAPYQKIGYVGTILFECIDLAHDSAYIQLCTRPATTEVQIKNTKFYGKLWGLKHIQDPYIY